jgi:hypothetical protein
VSLATAPILRAIREVCEGTIGTLRTVPAGRVAYGMHSGLAEDELARSSFVTPLFDVVPGELRAASSTTGLVGSFGIKELDITVTLAYTLPQEVLADDREAMRATVYDDMDVIAQALTSPRPPNLAQTLAAVPTNLVGGALRFENARIQSEDPDNNLITAELRFLARVKVSQAV